MKSLGQFLFFIVLWIFKFLTRLFLNIYFLAFYCRRCWLGWSGCGLGGLGSFFSSGCWWDSMCWFGWSGCGICGWMLMFNGLLFDFESLSPWSRHSQCTLSPALSQPQFVSVSFIVNTRTAYCWFVITLHPVRSQSLLELTSF